MTGPRPTHLLEGDQGQTWKGRYMDQENRRRKSFSTSDVDDQEQEGICVWSGPPQTLPEPSECLPGETAVRGKEASEEPGRTLTRARKPGLRSRSRSRSQSRGVGVGSN